MRICLLFLLLLCACAPSATNSLEVNQAPATEAERLLERRDQEGASVWADGNTLTFVYVGEAESVEMCCGFQESLTRLPDSNVWVLRKTVENLSRAVIGYSFVVNGEFSEAEAEVWRGSEAPLEPEVMSPEEIEATGRFFMRTLQSEILGENREIYVYLPPDHKTLKVLELPVVYLGDGGVVWDYARYVETLIKAGKLPELILIGIESGGYLGDPNAEFDYSLDMRAREYIPQENDDRFALHERFVLEEVLPWAEEEFGASNKREDRIVHGFSNGGVFAAAMGLRNPDVFGYALPFSVGIDPSEFAGEKPIDTKFYFVSGELEESFFETTQSLAKRLAEEGVTARFEGWVAGHDNIMWRETFPNALLWVFSN
jgi:enterochelin esterase-like enzyme